jgi:hypothetical protein
MADGCNLYFTEKDLHDVESSIDKGKVLNESKFAANALDCLLKKNPDEFIKVLENKSDPRHNSMSKLAIESFGKGKVSAIEEDKIPSALKTVLKFTPQPKGLFSSPLKAYGPGASRVTHPYEILAAAAIVQQKTIYSKSGKALHLYSTDKIFLGHKSAANHAMRRKGGTIESDILIERSDKSIAPTGIDAKYSSSGVYKSYLVSERQLKGIRNSINDGQIKEFFFITNGQFEGKFLDRVSDYNKSLTKDWIDSNKEYHSFKDTGKEYVERNYHQLVKDFNIPQINVCEGVSFQS